MGGGGSDPGAGQGQGDGPQPAQGGGAGQDQAGGMGDSMGGGGGFGGGGGGFGDMDSGFGGGPGAGINYDGDNDRRDRRGDFGVTGRPRNTTIILNTPARRDRTVYVTPVQPYPYIPTPVIVPPQPIVTTLPPPVIYQTQADAVTKPFDAPLTVQEWLLYSPARYPGYSETERINLLPRFNADPSNIRDARIWFTKNQVVPQAPAAPGKPATFVVEPIPAAGAVPEAAASLATAAAAAAARIANKVGDDSDGSYISGQESESGTETDDSDEFDYDAAILDQIRAHYLASQPRYVNPVGAVISQLGAHDRNDPDALVADCANAMLH